MRAKMYKIKGLTVENDPSTKEGLQFVCRSVRVENDLESHFSDS